MSAKSTVISTYQFSPASLEKLRGVAQAEVFCVPNLDELSTHLAEAEILCSYWLPDNWRELAPHLRWLQTSGAGVDELRSTGILDPSSSVIVTTAVGINAEAIGEYVFGSMLLFNRSWPQMIGLQDRHIWPRSTHWYNLNVRELAGQTLGIVGLGNIGRRVAQLGRAFGMQVIGTRRTPESGNQIPDIDQFYPLSRLHDMLHTSDYVVLAVPLTPETRHLIDEAALHAMRPHTYLVNVARGQVVDEPALIRALQEGWIAGAGLDVVSEEPLAANSPLFTLPNVFLTPHVAGESINYDQRLTDLFVDNLQRYRSGMALRNYYDPTRGY